MVRLAVVFLVISNIAVGAAGYLLLQRVDREYTDLMDASLPMLDRVRALSWQIVGIQRAVNRLADAEDTGRGQLLQRQREDLDDASVLLARIAPKLDTVAPPGTDRELTSLNDAYVSAILRWRALVAAGEAEAGAGLVVSEVRPAYDAYGERLEQLAVLIRDTSVSRGRRLTAQSHLIGNGLMAASTWPLWLSALVAVFISTFVAGLGLFLKARSKGLA